VWVLKCDIKKFFASIDQNVLFGMLRERIRDADVLWLIGCVLESFHSTAAGKGLPLGNLTSQLLVNVYMNEFDQFVKHTLKAKHYIRYADDFVIMGVDRNWLLHVLVSVEEFLKSRLYLSLHPDKVHVQTLASGVDFLGWVHYSHHRVLRTATKKRMFRALMRDSKPERVISYQGMLTHGNTRGLSEAVDTIVRRKWFGTKS
jgi:hypothetical protein